MFWLLFNSVALLFLLFLDRFVLVLLIVTCFGYVLVCFFMLLFDLLWLNFYYVVLVLVVCLGGSCLLERICGFSCLL